MIKPICMLRTTCFPNSSITLATWQIFKCSQTGAPSVSPMGGCFWPVLSSLMGGRGSFVLQSHTLLKLTLATVSHRELNQLCLKL